MMFSSLMVVVMLQMLLLQISADVNLSTSPGHIQVGLSPVLDANCTFSIDTSSDMAEVISLTLTRGSNAELGSITDYSDHKVNVISSEGITADGVINPGGQSYIHLHWDYPTDTQTGTYQCSAQGMDVLGHIITVSDTAVVIQDQVEMGDLMDKIREMDERLSLNEDYTKDLDVKLSQNEKYVKDLEQRLPIDDKYIIGQKNCTKELEEMLKQTDIYTKELEDKFEQTDKYNKELAEKLSKNNNYIKMLENYTKELEEKLAQTDDYTSNLEEKLSQNEDYIKNLEQNVSHAYAQAQALIDENELSIKFEWPPLIYQGKTYAVSRSPFTDFTDSINSCIAVGGQLAEINDMDEYHAVQNYMKTLSGVSLVYIGGTDDDRDGIWILPSSHQELPVTDWVFSDPFSGELVGCLCLHGKFSWRMYSFYCHYDFVYFDRRYMCEI